MPDIWKEAIVVPIFKKGLKNNPNNFRPISLTSAICRTLEKILQNKIIHHLTENLLLSKSQHGFLPYRSTLSLHLNLLDDLTKKLSKKKHVDMLYLDFSKAFDRVSHEKLIHCLTKYKIDIRILNWLRDYLSSRSQRTIVENIFSSRCNITSGVPQGSVMGPLLFLLYIEDLLKLLNQNFPSINAYAFADDLKILGSDRNTLQQALDEIIIWTQNWQLKIQHSKSEYITFKTPHTHSPDINHTYNINNNTFAKTDIVKDLGLYLTNNLTWTQYINKIHHKSNSLGHIILKSFSSQQPSLYIQLYKTYVRPLLEYNVSIWTPHLVHDIKLAENTQRTFTRKLCKKLNISYNNYLDRLKLLNIESLEYRRLKQDLILLYKIINDLIDVGNINLFTKSQATNNYNLRRHSLYLDKSKQNQSPIRQYFFSNRIINTWNKLPNSIVTSPTLPIFKNRINQVSLQTVHKFYFNET